MEPAKSPRSPSPSPSPAAAAPAMDNHLQLTIEEPITAVWDFEDLLDFTADDHFSIPWDPAPNIDAVAAVAATAPSDHEPDPDSDTNPNRIRKRDPRLVCSNFLAGRVPCACPEIDEKLEEEGLPGKKRTRTARVGSGVARCQVPGCEADIRELKGYHRRHRVCLRCANASTVVVDGETKRYCQQCGKFHILSDFDEGKRSCRRKLERHNNRRRRKPADPSGTTGKEFQQDVNPEDVAYDDDGGKDVLCSTNQLGEKETSLEPEDGRISPLSSNPESQTVHIDSVVSFAASRETQMGRIEDSSKSYLSPPYCDNRSTYSSMCPTGRISFKLYDWNPAEFPRRLRLQVFQWLASMPVELEGYIRPGCTILTMFAAMPSFMWVKLFEDPISSIHDLLVQPRSKLLGRGTFYVYLNNMIFCVKKGGTSVVRFNMEEQAPRLHYIYPACFEAGKPMEFVACGSNLLPSKDRFLISFGGKYLACTYSCMSSEIIAEGDNSDRAGHQLYKISIPRTALNLFGPAFVEVENDCGVSNFIPVLISNKEVCSEMRMIIDKSFSTGNSHFSEVASACSSREAFARDRTGQSEFLLDIAWLLKEPSSKNLRLLSTSQIQRFSCLLKFLIENESTVILERVLQVVKNLMDDVEIKGEGRGTVGADISLLIEQMDRSRNFLHQKLQSSRVIVLNSRQSQLKQGFLPQGFSQNEVLSAVPITDQDMEMGESSNRLRANSSSSSTFTKTSEADPLLDVEGVTNGTFLKKRPSRPVYFTSVLRSRPALYVVATATVCFGVCAVLLHPHKVGEFAVYIHRRLFDNP